MPDVYYLFLSLPQSHATTSKCIPREIERVIAHVILERPFAANIVMSSLPALTAQTVDLDAVESQWKENYGLDVADFDTFEFVDTDDGRLAVR